MLYSYVSLYMPEAYHMLRVRTHDLASIQKRLICVRDNHSRVNNSSGIVEGMLNPRYILLCGGLQKRLAQSVRGICVGRNQYGACQRHTYWPGKYHQFEKLPFFFPLATTSYRIGDDDEMRDVSLHRLFDAKSSAISNHLAH